MAVVFELALNFTGDEPAMGRAEAAAAAFGPIRGGEFEFPLQPYRQMGSRDVILSFVAFGEGWPGTPKGFSMVDMTTAALNESQLQLYELLQVLDGYQCALVGWDSDYIVEIDELASEWASTENWQDPSGLVVSDGLALRLAPTEHLVAFSPGYLWIPSTRLSYWRDDG